MRFENFLGALFFQNYEDTPLTYDGSVWSRRHVGKTPLSKYLKQWKERLYLGYIKIGSTEYPSRVWFSDLPINDTIQWGYERGTNLTTKAGDNLVGSANSGFKTYDLEIGDPFFITSGNDQGEYRIKEILSDQQVRLNDYNGAETTLKNTATGTSFWAGGNWFDVSRDDGDFITGLNSAFNQLLIYKRDSLHRYNGSATEEVRGGPGTTVPDSIVNIRGWSIHFYGGGLKESGFFAYDGTEIFKISNGIQRYIDGINLGENLVGWREGNLARWYVGDIVNTNYHINIPNAVISLDYDAKAWSIDPIGKAIENVTEFRSGGLKTSFIATDAEVFETPSGYTFDGTPVKWSFTTKPIYPEGTAWNNTMTKLQVISENASGVKVSYRRRLAPYNSDNNFTPLGDIRNDSQWLVYPEDKNRCSGVELKFDGISSTEPVPVIKKLSQFYIKETTFVNG